MPKVYCEIDGQSRTINVPEEYKILGVYNDKNTKTIHFKCPKAVDDVTDLGEYDIFINFTNAGGVTDAYLCEDVSDSEDGNITFSWKISQEVCEKAGKVSYIMCAKKIDDSGDVTNEWNTTMTQGDVLQGIEVEQEGE